MEPVRDFTSSFVDMPRRTSSVVGREFGDAVRSVIERTGLTHRKLAEKLDWDEAKLSDMVRGKGGVTETDLLMLLGYCQATPPEVQYLLAPVPRDARERLPQDPR